MALCRIRRFSAGMAEKHHPSDNLPWRARDVLFIGAASDLRRGRLVTVANDAVTVRLVVLPSGCCYFWLSRKDDTEVYG